MRLFQTGELKLLREVRKRFRLGQDEKGVVVGIGDDAAVIAPHHRNIIVTTDMMNEGVHFDRAYSSPFHLGFKLVSVNVSDIMAMGGLPKYLFLDLAFTGDTDEKFFKGIYDGIEQAMALYGISLLGGDLCSARNDMVLSATVIGEGGKIITRHGAVPGDRIYLTSSTGDSACGLEILKRLNDDGRERVKKWSQYQVVSGRKTAKKVEALKLEGKGNRKHIQWKVAEPLLRRHLMPVARDSRDIAPYASSMLDVSDGLFIDLCRICDESGTGASVYLDNIPLSKELKDACSVIKADALHFSVAGGEDYEILFTADDFPMESYNRTHEIPVSCIGEITKKERAVIDDKGRKTPLKAEGYQHFGAAG
ncbi:MAG TPA: thiamine-phosphate kinase [Dissulfurispiraceae bacterium]|nr:thiamine-phosphate kinase [Dissulfurispiraceae bacterium]